METVHKTQLVYNHFNENAKWRIIEWEKKKYTSLNRQYYVTLGDVNDPDAITMFMGDHKGGILKKEHQHWDVHNGAEIVLQLVEGNMHWYTGPTHAVANNRPGDFPEEEQVWITKPGEGVIFPAGVPHSVDPVALLPDDNSMVVLYSPARGSSFPIPENPEAPHKIEFTGRSFGEKGSIKFFDYGAWRCTSFDFRAGFLPKEPKTLAQNDFDAYVFSVRGQFEFWFDPDNQVEKMTIYPWDGMYSPQGLPHYGRQLGDWMGVVLTRHDDKTARRLEPEDWEKIIMG